MNGMKMGMQYPDFQDHYTINMTGRLSMDLVSGVGVTSTKISIRHKTLHQMDTI